MSVEAIGIEYRWRPSDFDEVSEDAPWLLRDVVGLTADDADLMRLLAGAVG